MPVMLALVGQRKEDHKFKISLDFTARSFYKTAKQTKKLFSINLSIIGYKYTFLVFVILCKVLQMPTL